MIFGFADYQQGDRNDGVWQLQMNLTNAGFDTGEIDGAFGPLTKAAVRNYQAAAGLEITGVADEGTLIALSKTLEKKGVPLADASSRPTSAATRPYTTRANLTTANPPVQVKQAGLSPGLQMAALAIAAVAALKIMSSR